MLGYMRFKNTAITSGSPTVAFDSEAYAETQAAAIAAEGSTSSPAAPTSLQ